ncbi:MAG: hypothetical protein K8E66_09060, partial [Phycisphaerales bacterium]|nr:hypothetical protein [Phycisphaerales bacterium]
LEEWAEMYDPTTGPTWCQAGPCVNFMQVLTQATALFSTVFEKWGDLVVYSSIYTCTGHICPLIHESGLFSERRLQGATDFLTNAKNYLDSDLQICEWD